MIQLTLLTKLINTIGKNRKNSKESIKSRTSYSLLSTDVGGRLWFCVIHSVG